MDRIVISGFSDEIAPSFDEQLAAVREFGVTHIELRAADEVNVSDFTQEKLKEVKGKLRDAGIRVSSIGSPIGKIGIEEDFAPHMDKLKRTLEIQKELEAPYIRMFSFYMPKDRDPQDLRGEVLERMGRMVEEAKAWDSVLLHENEKDIYGDNAPRCKELMEQFYGPNFKAVFDFANFVQVGQEPLAAYELMKPYVEYVHIKDAMMKNGTVVPPGYGDGHVGEILSQLIGEGFRGFLSLEPHLSNFSGLSSLEKAPQDRGPAMDGKSSWKLALDSLKKLLAEIPQAKEAL